MCGRFAMPYQHRGLLTSVNNIADRWDVNEEDYHPPQNNRDTTTHNNHNRENQANINTGRKQQHGKQNQNEVETALSTDKEEEELGGYNVAPTRLSPVIYYNKELKQTVLKRMRFGLIPSWSKEKPTDFSATMKTMNARDDTIKSGI